MVLTKYKNGNAEVSIMVDGTRAEGISRFLNSRKNDTYKKFYLRHEKLI